jgi:glycosyl-4,4'-diaponeurosporenoate acyltransferase
MFRYYIIAIIVGNILIGLINGLIGLPGYSTPVAMLVCLGVSVLFTALEFGLDALIAWLTRLLPKKAVDPFRKIYRVAKWEKKVYKKLGIVKWKDKIPEAGGLLAKFQKKKVLDFHDNEYIMTFMRESVYAEVMHVISALAGLAVPALCAVRLLWPDAISQVHWCVRVALPVALVNFVLQVLPVMVQRYVRPQLMSVYLRNQKRAQKQADAQIE